MFCYLVSAAWAWRFRARVAPVCSHGVDGGQNDGVLFLRDVSVVEGRFLARFRSAEMAVLTTTNTTNTQLYFICCWKENESKEVETQHITRASLWHSRIVGSEVLSPDITNQWFQTVLFSLNMKVQKPRCSQMADLGFKTRIAPHWNAV